jgi:hypothetical protein
MQYKIRDNFYIHGLRPEPYVPGEIVELTTAQLKTHGHKVEVFNQRLKSEKEQKNG